MAQEHLFISDVHLGAFDEATEKKISNDLVALIHYATKKKATLYILGDLFDYWMEYPGSTFVPEIGQEVLKAFEVYNRSVGATVFITGNHDNWTISHFSDLGFDVEEQFRLINTGSKTALLFHGDGIWNQEDVFTRGFLHRLLRNNRFLALYRFLFPEKIGIQLMKIFSNITRSFDRIDAVPLNMNAKEKLKNPDIDLIICGHDHIPRTELYEGGCYINTGTFFKHRSVGRIMDDEAALVQWKSSTSEFVPFGEL